MKEIAKKEIENLDNMIMNLEYQLNEEKPSNDERELINRLIEKYASIRQELLEMEEY